MSDCIVSWPFISTQCGQEMSGKRAIISDLSTWTNPDTLSKSCGVSSRVCVLIIDTLHTVGLLPALPRLPVCSWGPWCMTDFEGHDFQSCK